jgi:hypothetical protein
MNKLLTLVLFGTALFSCTVLKKDVNKSLIEIDSASSKKLVATNVKKSDSSYIGISKEHISKQGESTYTRTTTVKEYFGDEFSFENPNLVLDTNYSSKPGFLKYRETTTSENGNSIHTLVKRNKKEQRKSFHNADSLQKNQFESYRVNKSSTTKVANVISNLVLPGLMILLFLLFVAAFIYVMRKRLTIWQG